MYEFAALIDSRIDYFVQNFVSITSSCSRSVRNQQKKLKSFTSLYYLASWLDSQQSLAAHVVLYMSIDCNTECCMRL